MNKYIFGMEANDEKVYQQILYDKNIFIITYSNGDTRPLNI